MFYDIYPTMKSYEPKHFSQALWHFSEEVAELGAAIGKTGRWGIDSVNPELSPGDTHFDETNWEWIAREFLDVVASYDLLVKMYSELSS